MKQKTTKFEKVSSRQFAYLFLGIGAIGLALTVGGGDLGFNLGAIAAGIMLAGFILATIFLFMAGATPVATGLIEYEAEDHIQVVMSDDLNNEIKAKVELAIGEITKKNDAALEMFTKSVHEFAGKVSALENTLVNANVGAVIDQLSKITGSIDLSSTAEALGDLKGNMNALLSNLDNLSNLSSNSTSKLETILDEISENLSDTRNELKNKTKGISHELDSTLRALEAFNRV